MGLVGQRRVRQRGAIVVWRGQFEGFLVVGQRHAGRKVHLDTVMDVLLLDQTPWNRVLKAETNDPRRHHPLVVVRVDAHIVVLQVEGVLAELDMLEFVLVEVWPAPQPCVDHMGEAFPACNLQPAIQRPLNGHTLAGVDAIGGDGSDERVQLVLLLLKLLDQALDGPLGEALILAALTVAHEAVDDAEAGVVAARWVHRHDVAGGQLVGH